MAKRRIVVVEDDAIIAMELESRLATLGYAVSAVTSSGEGAVEKSETMRPDLVLMDIRLKGEMDGVEAAEQIRARFDIPVVYLTAHADETTLQRAKLTEPYGYILKPFEERELHSAIEMALYKHEMERKLRESERWLATTLRSIGDAVIATDKGGVVTFMNRVAEALTGWKQEEALGCDLAKVGRIADEKTHSAAETPVKTALQIDGVISLTDHILIARDGREIPIDVSVAPIRDERDDVTGVVLAFRDITDRKRAEKERAEMQTQLLQAQKMEAIGLLAGGVAHDFNNLLTIIIGYSQLALGFFGVGGRLRGLIEIVNRAGERAASLTQQLLAFSRRQMFQPKVMSLNAVVAEMGEMLGRLIGEDVNLSIVLEPTPNWVKADVGQIEQIIMNLVINAREAMPGGGNITIETSKVILDQCGSQPTPEARTGTFVCLSVTDTGVGIDRETIDKIFDPFFSTKKIGTGLGLSVVYGIAKQHGGWIDVFSEPGQGATFKVFLPSVGLKQGQESEAEVPSHELLGHGERILLVEDEESVRGFAASTLVENGYVVFEAASAEQALNVFEREGGHFHLVFSDVILPDKTGLQLVDLLRHRNPELQILLSSGYTDEKSQRPAIQDKGFRFLQKPYALTDLLGAIKNAIETGQVSPETSGRGLAPA